MIRQILISLCSLLAINAPHAEPVTFVISNINADEPLPLVLALFKPTSEWFDKRFKRPERADAFCRMETSGKLNVEIMTCDLPPSKYIGIAYVDADRNGELTHGVIGPSEQFGLTGIEEGVSFPPGAERTVIDTGKGQRFRIVLK